MGISPSPYPSPVKGEGNFPCPGGRGRGARGASVRGRRNRNEPPLCRSGESRNPEILRTGFPPMAGRNDGNTGRDGDLVI